MVFGAVTLLILLYRRVLHLTSSDLTLRFRGIKFGKGDKVKVAVECCSYHCCGLHLTVFEWRLYFNEYNSETARKLT